MRHALPDSHITLIGLAWAHVLRQRYLDYFDAFLELPGYPPFPETPFRPRQFASFIAEAQAREFDLAVQMHGDGRHSNDLIRMLGARHTAGFFLRGAPCPDERRYMPYPDELPEPRKWLELARFLGAEPQGEYLEFLLLAEDRLEFEHLSAEADLREGEYACIHPGSREPLRRWGVEKFADVADALAADGLRVILTGTTEESELTRAVERRMGFPALNFTGRTTLGGMGAVLSRSQLLVCNDTGVSHLAAALRVPSVITFVTSNPQLWAPLDHDLHRAVGEAAVGLLAGGETDLAAKHAGRSECGRASGEAHRTVKWGLDGKEGRRRTRGKA